MPRVPGSLYFRDAAFFSESANSLRVARVPCLPASTTGASPSSVKTRWVIAAWVALLAACQRTGSEQTPAAGASPALPVASATAGSVLAVGTPVPPIAALAHTGERVELAASAGRPLVVYFYPKDDTPGCTVEAQEIRDLWSEIQATSALVVGVSTDDTASHRAFAEKHALPFLLLADSDHVIAQAFGVPLKNGRASRMSFVFGRDGRLARVFSNVQPSGHGQELLSAIRELGG